MSSNVSPFVFPDQLNNILLTPGPITTSATVKQAMLQDFGSWDEDFNQITAFIRQSMLTVANAEDSHVCIPLQGSGTFAVEATMATLMNKTDKVLILMNGAYGQRIGKICEYLGRQYCSIDMGDYLPPNPNEVAQRLADDDSITHVAVVHCETSSGILNPIEAIAAVVANAGKELIIDSMSAFGALDIDASTLPFAALISSANKCFESVPGFGFSLIRQDLIEKCRGNAHSLSMDLIEQYDYMEKTGQWRFTPPTHTVAACAQALNEYFEQGGREARLKKYQNNTLVLVEGMRNLGFKTLLEDQWLSPIIVTFFSPEHKNFNFTDFYQALKRCGFIIYPGKLTQAESFRVGCIGNQNAQDYQRLIQAVARVLAEMGVVIHTNTQVAMGE